MLIEAIGLLVIVAGTLAFAAVCAWSVRTLKRETGSVFSLSMIAGAFAFYNLAAKIGNGDAALHNYVIGLIALAVIALDALASENSTGTRRRWPALCPRCTGR